MTLTNYKYLCIILAVLVVIFAALYFMKPDATISNVFEGVGNNLQDCNDRLADWKAEYGDAAASAEKQSALEDVFEDCQAELGESSDTLAE